MSHGLWRVEVLFIELDSINVGSTGVSDILEFVEFMRD